MKRKLSLKVVGGVALAGLFLGNVASADTITQNKDASALQKKRAAQLHPAKHVVERIILVPVTGSRIPQRVVVYGQQATSASPMYVIQGQELANTGAVSVGGLLSLDPSISVNMRRP